MRELAALLLKREIPAEAEPFFREALAMDRKLSTNSPARWETSLLGLTDALFRQGRYAEAETLLRAGVEDLHQAGSRDATALRPTLAWLVRLYEAWDAAFPDTGKSTEATRWRQALDELDGSNARAKGTGSHKN